MANPALKANLSVSATPSLPTLGREGENTHLSLYVRYITLCLIFLCMGIWRIQDVQQVQSEFTQVFNEKIDAEGGIVQEPDVRTDKQLLTVRLDEYGQNVLITLTKTNPYFYGDRVWVRGKLVEPKSFDDFDYRGYLERFKVYGLMRYPKVITLKPHQGNALREAILRVKSVAIARINAVLEEPYASLLLGILIGAKKTLSQDILDAFNNTGTSHIVAVSGFNISIIVGALGYVARIFGRRASMWLSVVLILVFVIMAGASASVIRAACMGILLLMSFNIGRLYAITPSLVGAAVLMLLINPRILFWDGSFQLSFIATAGIVYGVPILQRLFAKVPADWGIKDMLLVTLAANFATLPIILLMFSRLSIVSPLVNILVLPLVPMTMLLGALILVPVVGAGFSLVTSWLLWLMLKIVQSFNELSFASVSWDITIQTFWALWLGLLSGFAILHAIGKRMHVQQSPEEAVDRNFSVWYNRM